MMNRQLKRIAALSISVVMVAGALAGCGSSSQSAESEDKGKIYFLNSKPEIADRWKGVADKFTKETGIPVTVQTAASGTYEQTIKSEMAKSEPPTLFKAAGVADIDIWKDYTADLTNSELYKQLKDKSLALKSPKTGRPTGVPFTIESYGLIYNKSILDKYAKLDKAAIKSVKDIKSFNTLKKVADDMQKRKDELGIKGAFTSAGFDSSSSWRFFNHLANMPLDFEFKADKVVQQPATVKGTYLPQMKQIFDLYIKDSTVDPSQISGKTVDDANSEFSAGEAAFYQNGTWAWTDLDDAGMDADNVGMIPIYMGMPDEKNQGLATGSDLFWCINKKASAKNQKATEEFIKWLITSNEGINAVSKDLTITTPYKSFDKVKADNPLVNAMLRDMDSSSQRVGWSFTMDPSKEWKLGVGNALMEYGQGTAGWDRVQKAFVDGWATEYQANRRS